MSQPLGLAIPADTLGTTAEEIIQKALDLICKALWKGAHGCLVRGESEIVQQTSFWCYRQTMAVSIALNRGAGAAQSEILQKRLLRAQELAHVLSPHGELCQKCVREDEMTAAPADGQLYGGDRVQPIPICSSHAESLIDELDLQSPELLPIKPLWPPWSMNPAWLFRMAGTLSAERDMYACRQAALGGDPDAMYQMGQCHELGLGVAKHAGGAEHWYRLAENEGYPGAAEALERVQRGGPWKQGSNAPWWDV